MKQKDVLHVVGVLMYLSIINAVPLIRLEREVFSGNSSSLENECVSEDIIYKAGDEVPSPGPCEQCVCRPPKVECTMIKCKTNSGCKMIQRANHCCPDYMCDCEYKGHTYNNGERLELEDTPCQVCYCKGGEVMCTSITCYERTDCQPRYVPGQCCPKYDHCPSLETNGNSSINSTVLGSKREIQPWLMTKPVTVKPIEIVKQTTTKAPEEHTPPHVYPQTLKIHEILPTTPKYERPNGKRPALSTVPKVPLEIHIEEKASPIVEFSTESNMETASSSESDKGDSEEDKSSTLSQYSVVVTDSVVQPSTPDESLRFSTTVGVNSDVTTVPLISTTDPDAPSEYITTKSEPETTTEGTLPDLSYETIVNEDSVSENKANLVDIGITSEINSTPEPTSEYDKVSTSEQNIISTVEVEPSTESVKVRSVPSDGESLNNIVINDGSTTVDDSLTTYGLKYTSPDSELFSDSETINPTLSSFTLKMEPVILEGGVYDELNDTVLYTDDNDVKQEETTQHEENQENSPSTTETPDELSSLKSMGQPSALSEVFEKFVEIPQSSVSSIRRNDDWFSENYQFIPDDGAEESDERLLDLNVGATSHTDSRVSPAYYFGNSKESYLMSGRSLAPFIEKNKDSYPEKFSQEGKFQSDINKISTEGSFINSSSESSSEEDKNIFNPYEQSDLYLSITGKNSSSNETILHMILSPKDLKHLAEQIVKENINRTESTLKETEVKIEWLTQEQLSKLKPESPRVNINLTKCNFTGFTDLDLKSEKLKAIKNNITQNFNSEMKNANYEINQETEETSEGSGSELSTILTTVSDLLESTTVSYPSSTESSEQNITESTESVYNTVDEVTTKVNPEKLGPDTSTIKVYEIRQAGNINDKLIDLYITTEGPYGSDKISSVESTSQSNFPKSEISKRSESVNNDFLTENEFETTTSTITNASDKPRKKNLPDVEPFLRQLPSTLDEKDVSILRDFLERHLSDSF